MDLLQVSLLSLFLLLVVILSFRLLFRKIKNGPGPLPPGRTGWLLVGESIEFVLAGQKGQPETFILERMAKYSSTIFRTHLLGHPFTVFCGPTGNKFLFTNEFKLVQSWWPSSLQKVLYPSKKAYLKKDSTLMRKLLPKPEGLQRYIGIMDRICQQHFESGWENKDQVKTFPLCSRLTFLIACKLFVSVEDPTQVDKLLEPFSVVAKGIFSIPIDLPGTAFNRAIKASKYLRKMIKTIIKQRKIDLAQGKALPTQDILSHLLLTTDENGTFMNDSGVTNKIMGLLIAGHETTTSVCTSVVRFLADLPEIYEGVYKEQMEIAKSKAPHEFLNWDDIQKMSYSWNVVCEVLRLAPPNQGAFKEALADFTFNGFSIPKGSKIHWSLNTTHRNAEYFPEPKKFDPSRFEGSGPTPYTYIPFGGGPRMCPGREFARLEILVFIHNLVKRFRWEKIILNEKFIAAPSPNPVHGLPIKLYPHKA